ncbi:transketolase family protein [Artemisia annua]|uniref:pyruvate dehydrogenase (acetyl-transferring) n=1 Tax=Artemisia annua TaxID=35608 RepID=A0A2U1NJ06_ARTAN|nr:transketolase family protein [Artemisia annua]
MASIYQPVRATTTLTSSTLSSRRSLTERKVSFVVLRSGGVKDSGLKRICCRGDQFVTNAVAAKADTPAESTASKPGIKTYDLLVDFVERKVSFVVVRSGGVKDSGLKRIRCRGDQFVTNAVAAKADTPAESTASKPGHELLLFEALREGLEEEMERDARVCVIGEDVGHYGGSYKVTKGLADKYGDLRVLDTPIAENSFTGMGIGAAMTGLRPIIEGMNMGFLLLAFNQISNNCGMLHYTSGGQFKIPVVIRGPGGVGRQLGAEHSQRLESYFQSIPGIQMVACSTPYNAKGLMKAAIRSDNPVILFEHVLLYNLKERIPDEEYVLSLEEAEMVRPGEHVTILTYSRMRYHVMQAAKTLVNKGYDPEVIDIRSLKPFDLYTIGNSIKKTHRVLIVEECMRTGGIGASLTAAITENFNDYLDAPIMCLSSQDVPTPYAGTLEEWTVVQPPQIVAAVEQLCQ